MKKMLCYGMVVNGVMITVKQYGERYVVAAEGHGYYMSNGIIFTREKAVEEFRKEVEYHRGY